MVLPLELVHPEGETKMPAKHVLSKAVEVETYTGKIHVEWDPTAAVTPIGQLAFFIEFLKPGHRFDPWVDDCPLHYRSHNAGCWSAIVNKSMEYFIGQGSPPALPVLQ